MAVLQHNSGRVPFFCKTDCMKGGLNILGIRNPAESIFTRVLPGLNNVTLRIRYYSFYCWIISLYYETHEKHSKADFNGFIRRAEYLLAVINASNENRGGIPGITWAIEGYEESEGNGVDIALGADREPGKSTYWANPGGILQAYYIASLLELGILGYVKDDNSMYNITDEEEMPELSGAVLADAFAESVGEKNGELFVECVEKGFVSQNEIETLARPFFMREMTDFPEEARLLTELLVQKDHPTWEEESFHRRDTIRYFLEYCAASPADISEQGFAEYMAQRCKSEAQPDATLQAWYYYYLNDQWQYLVTSIFTDLLSRLAESGIARVDSLTDEMERDIAAPFKSETIDELLHKEIKTIDAGDIESAPANAFCRLVALVADNGVNYCGIMGELGINTVDYTGFAERMMASGQRLKDYILDFIQEDIIYRHYAISFMKQQYTHIATQKFILENDTIRFVANYPATHTSPRIGSLKGFLEDLGYLAEGEVTEAGINLIKTLSHD